MPLGWKRPSVKSHDQALDLDKFLSSADNFHILSDKLCHRNLGDHTEARSGEQKA